MPDLTLLDLSRRGLWYGQSMVLTMGKSAFNINCTKYIIATLTLFKSAFKSLIPSWSGVSAEIRTNQQRKTHDNKITKPKELEKISYLVVDISLRRNRRLLCGLT
ncbi:hypothetical protein EON65_10405 [archaeon]|nr:MAG: hypothetical protein EON65_10405 [archaeon]